MGYVADVVGVEVVGRELIEDGAVVSETADGWEGLAGASESPEGGEVDGVSEVVEGYSAREKGLCDGPVLPRGPWRCPGLIEEEPDDGGEVASAVHVFRRAARSWARRRASSLDSLRR